jgi:hypothetical protein
MAYTWDNSIIFNGRLFNNLLGLNSTSGGWTLVRGTTGYTTGKYYFEAKFINNTDGSNGDLGVGVIDGSADMHDYIGHDAHQYGWFPISGNILYNAGTLSTIQTAVAGNTLCVAVDYGAKLIWFRTNNGNWNNSGTANPATGTGGISFSGLSGTMYPAISCSNYYGTSVANFGATTFAQTVPSGFSGYDSLTPTVVTFDPNFIDSVTLSGGNLTAVGNNTNANADASLFYGAGKYYCEYIINTNAATTYGSVCAVITNQYMQVGNYPWAAPQVALAYFPSNGAVLGAATGTIQTANVGDTICIAMDVDNQKVWFRTNSGNWNNDVIANQNPTTNTGGLSVSNPFSRGSLLAAAFYGGNLNGSPYGKVTANFGGSAFGYAMPSGFTSYTPPSGGPAMAFVIADRVKETTTTTGTGTINLAGAATQFQGFIAGIGNGNTTYYCILGGNGTDWEVGIGTVTSGSPNTLSRSTILASSNSGSAINLSGTSTVFGDVPAAFVGSIQFASGLTATGSTLGGALPLTAIDNQTTGGATGTGVSLLPAKYGVRQRFHNRSGNQQNVWPNSVSETIETSGGAGQAVPINNLGSAWFIPITSTSWLVA